MIVRVLTTRHTQYTADSSMYVVAPMDQEISIPTDTSENF
jgi:hypothetical protein